MKKYIIILIVFVLSGTGVWGYVASEDKAEETNYKKVKVAKANEKEFQDVFISSGVVRGESETDLSFEIPGRINYLSKNEGDQIKKREVLATLDSSVINAERNLAREQAGVSANVSEKTDDYYDQLIDEAEASLEKAERSYDIAKDADDKDAEKMAEKSLEQAEEAVSSAEKMKKLQVEIVSGEKDIYASKVKVYDENVQKTKLVAPYNGIIISRNFDVGSVVSGGTVFKIAKSDNKEVEISVPLNVFEHVEIGKFVRVFSDDGKELMGEVKAKSPRSDEAEFKAKIIVGLGAESFEFGTFVKVEIPMGNKRDTIAVPIESVKKEYHENIVFVVENYIAKPRFVELGAVQNGMAEIKSGIKEGEHVVVSGNQYLRNNDEVDFR